VGCWCGTGSGASENSRCWYARWCAESASGLPVVTSFSGPSVRAWAVGLVLGSCCLLRTRTLLDRRLCYHYYAWTWILLPHVRNSG
jgi:hypothetical protein